MVWSEFITDSITLPFGATTGARIVISGTSIIEYAADNSIVSQIDPVNGNLFLGGIKTALSGGRWELFSNPAFSNILSGYTGDPAEVTEGQFQVEFDAFNLFMKLLGPTIAGIAAPEILLTTKKDASGTLMQLVATNIIAYGLIEFLNALTLDSTLNVAGATTLQSTLTAVKFKQVGAGSIAGLAAGAGTTVALVFPTAFATPPTVVVSSASGRLVCYATNTTTSGCTLGFSNLSSGATGNVSYAWAAFA